MGTPAIAEVARSDDHHAVTAALRFGGMVGTSQAGESITAARSIVTQLHPRRFARIRHRSWRHHRGRVRGNRQTDPAHYGNDNRGVTDPLVDRLPIRDHRDGAVVVGRRFPSRGQADRFRPCRPRFHRDIPVFLGLSVAVVVGAGTGFAMFLIGRYHERRRQHIAPAAALADAYRGWRRRSRVRRSSWSHRWALWDG